MLFVLHENKTKNKQLMILTQMISFFSASVVVYKFLSAVILWQNTARLGCPVPWQSSTWKEDGGHLHLS